MLDLMSNGGVCRTALATLGVLSTQTNFRILFPIHWSQLFVSEADDNSSDGKTARRRAYL